MSNLSLLDFGKRLLDTNDLDPVYVLIHESNLNENQIRKWLLAYFCFYHVGTSSWIIDQNSYWGAMLKAAGSKDYPRCRERRHFRGLNALKSVTYLKNQGLESLFKPLINPNPVSVGDIMSYVQTWVGFGPWIAFKVADFIERLGLAQVQFYEGSIFMFDSPRKGATLAWKIINKDQAPVNQDSWAVNYLTEGLKSYLAPPSYDRPIGLQEAETVLCKWHSYMGGHYKLNEDVEAIPHALACFNTKTCKKLTKVYDQYLR